MSSSLETMSEKQLVATLSNHEEIMQRIKDELKSRKTEKSKKVVKVTIKKEPKKESKSSSIFSFFSSDETPTKVSKDEPKKKKTTEKTETSFPKEITCNIMKQVLDYRNIDYPTSAKKDELIEIVRKARLVTECKNKV